MAGANKSNSLKAKKRATQVKQAAEKAARAKKSRWSEQWRPRLHVVKTGGRFMGDKSPRNNAKSKKQKDDKQKAENAARQAAAEAKSAATKR